MFMDREAEESWSNDKYKLLVGVLGKYKDGSIKPPIFYEDIIAAYTELYDEILILMDDEVRGRNDRHSEKVIGYSMGIADEMGLDDEKRFLLHCASKLHDIGKLLVPAIILNSKGNFEKDDMLKVRAHPRVGRSIIEQTSLPFCTDIGYIVYCHHENIHPKFPGYYNIPVNDIPFLSMILRVSDSIDAMTSEDRVYEKTKTFSECMKDLLNWCDKWYERNVVIAFIRSYQKHPPGS